MGFVASRPFARKKRKTGHSFRFGNKWGTTHAVRRTLCLYATVKKEWKTN